MLSFSSYLCGYSNDSEGILLVPCQFSSDVQMSSTICTSTSHKNKIK